MRQVLAFGRPFLFSPSASPRLFVFLREQGDDRRMLHLGRHSFSMLTLAVAVGIGGAGAATPAPKEATFECDYVMRAPTYGVIESATLTMKGKMVRYRKR